MLVSSYPEEQVLNAVKKSRVKFSKKALYASSKKSVIPGTFWPSAKHSLTSQRRECHVLKAVAFRCCNGKVAARGPPPRYRHSSIHFSLQDVAGFQLIVISGRDGKNCSFCRKYFLKYYLYLSVFVANTELCPKLVYRNSPC